MAQTERVGARATTGMGSEARREGLLVNREDVIRLMLEAEPDMLINIKDHEEGMEGFTGEDPKLLQFWPFKTYVKFAALVATAEREACAKIAEKWYATRAADAIRARSET